MDATAAIEPVIVVAPDSFKGSLSAPDAAAAIAVGILRALPTAVVRCRPMADGGEGTLDAVLSRGGQRRSAVVTGASGTPASAAFGLLDDGKTAVIEAAQVVGLTDASGTRSGVEQRTTFGIGELIRLLLDAGINNFMIGLGGSSTNDGGAGTLAALGVGLLDSNGAFIAPTPEGLEHLARIDTRRLDARLKATRITIMSDVNNPLLGERGATAIFGPQKGVARDRVATIDARLARYAALLESSLGRTARDSAGAGAAGGVGFALQLLGGKVHAGADVVADLVELDAALRGAHWLITGEGKSDLQTLLGKTPLIAAARAAVQGVAATLISGGVDRSALPQLSEHFAGCFALPFGPATLEECVRDAGTLLTDTSEQVARLLAATVFSRAR